MSLRTLVQKSDDHYTLIDVWDLTYNIISRKYKQKPNTILKLYTYTTSIN